MLGKILNIIIYDNKSLLTLTLNCYHAEARGTRRVRAYSQRLRVIILLKFFIFRDPERVLIKDQTISLVLR